MRYGYKEWVKTRPCMNCGNMPSDPDHNPTRGSRGNLDHDLVIPLCRSCHVFKGQVGAKTFAMEYLGKDYVDIVIDLFELYATDIMRGHTRR